MVRDRRTRIVDGIKKYPPTLLLARISETGRGSRERGE